MNNTDTKDRKLIIFTRYPTPGDTKTRLIPELGEEGAAQLQKRMTETVCRTMQPFLKQDQTKVVVSFEGESSSDLEEWLGSAWSYTPQSGDTLGDRMYNAFDRAFQEGFQRSVIIGSDCPTITCSHVEKAWGSLQEHDLVLGPARDGGYYLIGLSTLTKDLFRGVNWGTDAVFDETLRRAKKMDLDYETLEVLQDIDRPEDLENSHLFS